MRDDRVTQQPAGLAVLDAELFPVSSSQATTETLSSVDVDSIRLLLSTEADYPLFRPVTPRAAWEPRSGNRSLPGL